MKISRLGEAPDYRFSLANERTFLAWIRTALGFLAAGVGLDQLAPDFATPLIREILALLLCLFAGGMAIYGYLRWLNNEKAMRLKQDLPYTRTLLVISILLLAVVAGSVLTSLSGYLDATAAQMPMVALASRLNPALGIVGVGLNYLIYKKLLRTGKEKYAFEILQLAREISESAE